MEPESPTDFERAILEHLAREDPAIRAVLPRLLITTREFTGVGSFTYFQPVETLSGQGDRVVTLKGHIAMPGVPNGMGAVLFLGADQPPMLETFTYGDEQWNCVFEGFQILDIT